VRDLGQQTIRAAGATGPDVRLILRACPRNVAVIRQVFGVIAETLGMDAGSVGRLKLAVSEAGSNVVLHAYADGNCGVLEVDALVEDGFLHVIVRDRGDGIRPRPDSPGLGLGLPLIASVSDGLEINAGAQRGNEVRISFARGGRVRACSAV